MKRVGKFEVVILTRAYLAQRKIEPFFVSGHDVRKD
jgi:hypothetical protein